MADRKTLLALTTSAVVCLVAATAPGASLAPPAASRRATATLILLYYQSERVLAPRLSGAVARRRTRAPDSVFCSSRARRRPEHRGIVRGNCQAVAGKWPPTIHRQPLRTPTQTTKNRRLGLSSTDRCERTRANQAHAARPCRRNGLVSHVEERIGAGGGRGCDQPPSATLGLSGESPWPGARTTTGVPTLTRL